MTKIKNVSSRGLRMLSLLLGSAITDGSVASICSSYPNLELLDLSGSSITDSGIGMICNVFPETLSKLLLALCPNITSSGIQFAAAQLPYLELLDCGMTIRDPSSLNCTDEEDYDSNLHETSNSKLHLVYQKLIIKHDRLKKLKLMGLFWLGCCSPKYERSMKIMSEYRKDFSPYALQKQQKRFFVEHCEVGVSSSRLRIYAEERLSSLSRY